MKKYTHYLMPVALLALLLIGIASVANAGTMPGQRRDEDVTRGELLNFDRFLDDHPGIAKDLTKNPALINSSDYVEDHPELREFLKNHPEVREELKENPRFFMKRERRFERRGGDITRGELRNFDGFLDNHPEIDKELRKNPRLVNNEDYLEKHPELREFLKNHPGVREELKENPRFFMKRERRFDRRERRRDDNREDRRERRKNGQD